MKKFVINLHFRATKTGFTTIIMILNGEYCYCDVSEIKGGLSDCVFKKGLLCPVENNWLTIVHVPETRLAIGRLHKS